jgi:hypothetical protein
MPLLFTQAWDIIQGKEDEYAEYISGHLLREMTEAGFTIVGGFYVEVGFGPRVIGVHSTENFETLSKALTSPRFKETTIKVKSMVYNYRTAVLEPLGKVKREAYTIQKGVWKLNQYYDLRPGKKKEYADFIMNEHIPTLEKLDYLDVTGGWNVVVGGVSEIIAELTFRDPVDIGRLLNNEDFRRLTLKLRTEYVTNYASRILRCTERFDEPKWFRL